MEPDKLSTSNMGQLFSGSTGSQVVTILEVEEIIRMVPNTSFEVLAKDSIAVYQQLSCERAESVRHHVLAAAYAACHSCQEGDTDQNALGYIHKFISKCTTGEIDAAILTSGLVSHLKSFTQLQMIRGIEDASKLAREQCLTGKSLVVRQHTTHASSSSPPATQHVSNGQAAVEPDTRAENSAVNAAARPKAAFPTAGVNSNFGVIDESQDCQFETGGGKLDVGHGMKYEGDNLAQTLVSNVLNKAAARGIANFGVQNKAQRNVYRTAGGDLTIHHGTTITTAQISGFMFNTMDQGLFVPQPPPAYDSNRANQGPRQGKGFRN